MDVLLANPPWVNGPHDVMQKWLRAVVRRSLLRFACRKQEVAGDVIQEAFLKALICRDGRTTPDQALLHSADLEHTLIFKLIHEFTLFLSALYVVRKALTFVAVTPPRLVTIRDKVKSLNLPLRLIPKSLHPAHAHTSPVGG